MMILIVAYFVLGHPVDNGFS